MENKNEQSHMPKYEHMHMHDHDHDFVHMEIPPTTMKDLALLEYMLEHNKQHVNELANLSLRLADEGYANAAELVNDAVHLFHQANDNLQKAIGLVH